MLYNFKGYRIQAIYLDRFYINAKVIHSSVNSRGETVHTVFLDRPLKILGVEKSELIINHKNVIGLLSYPLE